MLRRCCILTSDGMLGWPERGVFWPVTKCWGDLMVYFDQWWNADVTCILTSDGMLGWPDGAVFGAVTECWESGALTWRCRFLWWWFWRGEARWGSWWGSRCRNRNIPDYTVFLLAPSPGPSSRPCDPYPAGYQSNIQTLSVPESLALRSSSTNFITSN